MLARAKTASTSTGMVNPARKAELDGLYFADPSGCLHCVFAPYAATKSSRSNRSRYLLKA